MAQAHALHARPARRASVGRRALALTRRAWTRYWTRRAARATAGILSALDDRALKDIGLDRSEIDSVVYGECGRRERRVGMGCRVR